MTEAPAGSWFGPKRKLSKEQRRKKLLRLVKTASESKFGLGGRVKEGGHAPKKITLRKMSWEGDP